MECQRECCQQINCPLSGKVVKRALWSQETGLTGFEEAYEDWTEKPLAREESTSMPGVCSRTFPHCVYRCGDQKLHVGQEHPAVAGSGEVWLEAWWVSHAPGSVAATGHDDPSGWQYPRVGGRPGPRPDRDHGRCRQCILLDVLPQTGGNPEFRVRSD